MVIGHQETQQRRQEVAKTVSVLKILTESEYDKSRGKSIGSVVKSHNAARLVDASMNQDAQLVQELLAAGTDPNYSDDDGRFALHAAVFDGNVEIMNWLLCARANPNCIEQPGGGDTPLQLAVWQGHTAAVRSLLEARANPNMPNIKGETPMYTAAVRNHKQAVQALLKHGSDADRPVMVGGRLVTPLQAAVEGRCSEVFSFLKSIKSVKSVGSPHEPPPQTASSIALSITPKWQRSLQACETMTPRTPTTPMRSNISPACKTTTPMTPSSLRERALSPRAFVHDPEGDQAPGKQ